MFTVVANFSYGQCIQFPSVSIQAAGVDNQAKLYLAYAVVGEESVVNAYELKTAQLVTQYRISGNGPLNTRWDPVLRKFIGLQFDGLVAFDSTSYEYLVHFKPTLVELESDTSAIDVQNHVFYFYNISLDNSAYLVGIDIVNKKIVSSSLLDAEGTKNVQYLWWNYPQNRNLYGINGWKSVDTINPQTGKSTSLGPIHYIPYTTGAFDPATQYMTFIGTDGDTHSLIVTLQQTKTVSHVIISSSLVKIPGGLAYGINL